MVFIYSVVRVNICDIEISCMVQNDWEKAMFYNIGYREQKNCLLFFPALDVTFIMFIRQLHHSNGSELKSLFRCRHGKIINV